MRGARSNGKFLIGIAGGEEPKMVLAAIAVVAYEMFGTQVAASEGDCAMTVKDAMEHPQHSVIDGQERWRLLPFVYELRRCMVNAQQTDDASITLELPEPVGDDAFASFLVKANQVLKKMR